MLALVKNCGMSDDQRDNEHGCMKRVQALAIELLEVARMVNSESALEHINIAECEAFIHDSLPDFGQWEEKISIARRG